VACGAILLEIAKSFLVFAVQSGRLKVEHPVYNSPHAPAGVGNGVKLSDLLDA
jgi:hypothetical protein